MKKAEMQSFIQQWDKIEKMKIFELEVKNKKTGETDYLIFDIFIHKGYFVAQHEPLNKKEVKSKKIAHKKIKIDADFSIDQHLQELYDVCIYSIIESDFFTLPNDEEGTTND